MFKKSANLVLTTDEEDLNVFLSNLNHLLVLMNTQPSLIDFYNWLHLSARFYDHTRNLKTKTATINLPEKSYGTIQMLLIFPFKHFNQLDIQEVNLKKKFWFLKNAFHQLFFFFQRMMLKL